MKIGYRVIKTAIGTGLSIAIAYHLGLEFYTTAGMITLLSIKPTKKQSFVSAWERLIACSLGIIMSVLFFHFLGKHPWTITLLLLLLIPALVYLNVRDAIPTSAVVSMHLYTLPGNSIDSDMIANEFALIGIGIAVALLFNLYIPKRDQQLIELQQKIEENFRQIFLELATYLREGDSVWDGREITETAQLIKDAKDKAIAYIENDFSEKGKMYYEYFEMREQQFIILERIIPVISSLHKTDPQGERIAKFLEELASGIHPGNTAEKYLELLHKMKEEFRQAPLPTNQEELEIRAALLFFIGEMKRYLLIKKRLAKKEWSSLIKR